MISFIVAAVAAVAQPAAKPVDPAALAAATALVQQLDVRGQISRGMAQNVQAMKSGVALRAMLAQQPGFAQAYQANRAKFDPVLQKAGGIQAEIAQKVINDNINAVVAESARAYARNYTAAELKGLSDFYRSPLGQTFQRSQPQVSAEIGAATGRAIGSKLDAAMQANSARLQTALAPLNAAPPPKKK
ncbi:hypothetical protein GCM10011529_30160 [Polymorphobacter glacialis]|uniref:DUF2059 domain-containing protein n=1 Tax=Sandarakinorhabdus glacialis TaxID=1614636 RepID=A0A917A0Y1_9SPHN|nr:DUF2059 domain-containing protein [Polymorphobacter glacialis]GGE21485.1 hypothetical protein GCM10011529_30160 [Polymorphobacter glacialis]